MPASKTNQKRTAKTSRAKRPAPATSPAAKTLDLSIEYTERTAGIIRSLLRCEVECLTDAVAHEDYDYLIDCTESLILPLARSLQAATA